MNVCVRTPSECVYECDRVAGCSSWTWQHGHCQLMSSTNTSVKIVSAGAISGNRGNMCLQFPLIGKIRF